MYDRPSGTQNILIRCRNVTRVRGKGTRLVRIGIGPGECHLHGGRRDHDDDGPIFECPHNGTDVRRWVPTL